MSKKKYHVILRSSERRELGRMLRTGTHSARVLNRARILLLADEHETDEAIADTVRVSCGTVCRIRKRSCQEGFLKALKERPRSGAPSKLSGRAEAQLTVIACTDPPEGRERWTHRLLADKLVQLEVVDAISYRTVGLY